MHTHKHIPLFLAFLFLLLPTVASAATLSLHATPTSIGVGDVMRVTILLDSAIPVNAFSGTLSYATATLEPIAISDGNSIVSLWVTHPAVPSASAPIAFTGITPGGFSGDAGVLFSVLFRAKAVGKANVSLGDIELLRNDGTGEKEPTITKTLTLIIGSRPSGGYTEPVDATPPESFTALLGTDSQLFGGKVYLVFMAVDKISGVDHYTIAESRVPHFLFSFFPLVWATTTSPYALADQNLTSTVYIKAVDRAGNERFSVFPPPHLFTVYEKVVLLAILTVLVFLVRMWRRRR